MSRMTHPTEMVFGRASLRGWIRCVMVSQMQTGCIRRTYS
jgi:hypothetical protein